jgi:S-DNA-T family DNA segregation ATPase FtsK/SpoIIIE
METSASASTLTALQLLGQVAAAHLRQHLLNANGIATPRFILDRLTPEQVAVIAQTILDDEWLREQFEMQLPRFFLADFNLPEEALTDERATLHRNLKTSRAALLIANTGDDEAQSLEMVTAIGATQLLNLPELWIGLAAEGLPISAEAQLHWVRALTGLRDLSSHALERLAEYVVATRSAIQDHGLPLVKALGYAFPALRTPRDTGYFETSLAEKLRGRASEWKKLYEKAERQRAPYLRRQTPSQTLLSESDLQASFTLARKYIPERLHPQVQAFIESDSGWYPTAEALAMCEWSEDNIESLFSGLKREKTNLGQITIDFYEDNNPEALSQDDREYLKRLSKRRTTSTHTDEDQDFHEAHRQEYQTDRRLKVLWDRFIHGAPLETEDFLAGLALRLERLFVDENSSKRKLKIRLEGKTRRDFKELNTSAGLYFATRYRGLVSALGNEIDWQVGQLFEFPDLVEQWAAKSKGKKSRNISTAKNALQLRFTLQLETVGTNGSEFTNSTQLIWKFDPKKAYSELAADWERLNEYPMRLCDITRETVNARGVSQSVDLNNVQTFVPTHDKDRGSFVATYSAATDVAHLWPANLQQRVDQGLLTKQVADDLLDKWEAFRQKYSQAIQEFYTHGFQSKHLVEQAQAYGELLTLLCREAKAGHSRQQLVRPLLRLGSVTILGGAPAEIIAPWHPLRLMAMSVKVQRVRRLLDHLLHAPVLRLGDNAGRLFFKDLQAELEHPFYPEVVLGWQDSQPELLGLSDTCADYSLHEPPRIGSYGLEETSENPTEGARRVVDLVERYLALQPHENANLSVVLYNCDSARLPQAVVDRLGNRSEDAEDTRCQVLLRHRDANKLRQLYERIVESSDADPDAFNASEATRDFMARLRISISADQASVPNRKDGPPNDIVFSQDVISRHAHLEWYHVDATPIPLLDLVPAHWSRRRPVPLDDTKSVVYLCCPVQSSEGWAYLTAITTFLKGDWDGVELWGGGGGRAGCVVARVSPPPKTQLPGKQNAANIR